MAAEGLPKPDGTIVIATLAINILSLALPVMTLQVYDRIIPNHSTGTLEVLVLGVTIALALETILKLARAYTIGWTGAMFEHRMSCRLINHVLGADSRFFSRDDAGAHLQRMSGVGRVKSLYDGDALTTALEAVFVLVFLGVMAWIGGLIVLVPVVVLTLFVAITMYYTRKLHDGLTARSGCDEARYNFLVQSLRGIHTVKSFGLEQMFVRRFEKTERASDMANLNVSQISSDAFNAGAVLANLMLASVITVGALQVTHGAMTVGTLVACILLAGRMMQPVQRVLQLWVRLQDCRLAQADLAHITSIPHITRDVPAEGYQVQGQLELVDLTYQHPHQEHKTIDGVNLNLTIGQSILIHGTEGAGKTTLMKLIAGLYPPSSGHVRLDGREAVKLPANHLAQHVAFLEEEGTTFRGTLRDNLTAFGLIPEADAMAMARILGLHYDVARLPNGFDTPLAGTAVEAIPPGLRQRVAIARGLAAGAKIVLFDNADHGLDPQAARLLLEVMTKLQPHVVLVMISRDPAFQALAKAHMLLADGHLAPVTAPKQKSEQKTATHEQVQS